MLAFVFLYKMLTEDIAQIRNKTKHFSVLTLNSLTYISSL